MTLRQIRIGAVDNISQYDDVDYNSAIETDQPMKAGTPIDPTDVLRLNDVGALVGDVVGPAGATADHLAAFNGATGKSLKDSGLATADVSDAVSKKHTRSHAISSTSDHSDVNLAGISNNDLMQWDDPSSKWEPKSIAEVIANQNISPGQITQETYCIRKVISKTGIADNVATSVFRIATTDEASNDGGGYSCKVHALIGHNILANAGALAAKSFLSQFAHINGSGGSAATSAVSEIVETASAADNPASRDIGAVTMTTVATSNYQTDIQFQIDLTGSSVVDAEVVCIVELIYWAYTTPPTITAL